MTRTLLLLGLAACTSEPTFPTLDGEPVLTTMFQARDGLDKPRDLEFHPNRDDQLWVVNRGTVDEGSNVVIIDGAATGEPAIDVRRDGNAWHFMNTTTAMAFSNNGNWATSPEITDANHSGGTFTGPSLWSSDMDIFAMPSGGNGSHLDMLHSSPNAMGIAHDRRNAFWVFDGYDNELVWYDFVDDHGPGNDDHSDGRVHRYSGVPLERVNKIPSHMEVDHDASWLYIADTAQGRVLRVDTDSGSKANDLPFRNEPLAQHWQMEGEVWEVFAEGLIEPSGLALDEAERLLYAGDHGTGEIVAYDLDTGAELGRVQTEARALMGMALDASGQLWFIDGRDDTITRLDAATE
jgi:sugar lactone lactonase YvrE